MQLISLGHRAELGDRESHGANRCQAPLHMPSTVPLKHSFKPLPMVQLCLLRKLMSLACVPMCRCTRSQCAWFPLRAIVSGAWSNTYRRVHFLPAVVTSRLDSHFILLFPLHPQNPYTPTLSICGRGRKELYSEHSALRPCGS